MARITQISPERVPVINLEKVAPNDRAPYISGKERGESARRFFKLDESDGIAETVEVVIPDHVKSISSSFALGLFSPSVKRLGSVDAFSTHYRFAGDNRVVKQIFSALNRGASKSLKIK